MKFDVTKEIRRLNDTAFTPQVLGLEGDDDRDTPILFREILVHALLNLVDIEGRDQRGVPIPKKMTGKEKFDRFRLAEKITDEDILEMDQNEMDILKDATSVLSPEVMGRVWKFLETPVLEN